MCIESGISFFVCLFFFWEHNQKAAKENLWLLNYISIFFSLQNNYKFSSSFNHTLALRHPNH